MTTWTSTRFSEPPFPQKTPFPRWMRLPAHLEKQVCSTFLLRHAADSFFFFATYLSCPCSSSCRSRAIYRAWWWAIKEPGDFWRVDHHPLRPCCIHIHTPLISASLPQLARSHYGLHKNHHHRSPPHRTLDRNHRLRWCGDLPFALADDVATSRMSNDLRHKVASSPTCVRARAVSHPV